MEHPHGTSSSYHEQPHGQLPIHQPHPVQKPSLTFDAIESSDADSGVCSTSSSVGKCSFDSTKSSSASMEYVQFPSDVIQFVNLIQFLTAVYSAATATERDVEPAEDVVLYDLRENRAFQNRRLKGAHNANCHSKMMTRRAMQQHEKLTKGKRAAVYLYGRSSSSKSGHIQVFLDSLTKRGDQVVVLECECDGTLKDIDPMYLTSSLGDEERREFSHSPTSSHGYGSDDVLNAHVSEVLPHLFLGNQRDAQDEDLLNEKGITHIVNVTKDTPNKFEDKNVKYLKLPASDDHNQSLIKFFDSACQFILDAESEGGKVLVHCRAGVSRSATIIMAYLIGVKHCDPTQAFQHILSCRSIVSPNFHFLGQIEKFYKELRSKDKVYVQSVSARGYHAVANPSSGVPQKLLWKESALVLAAASPQPASMCSTNSEGSDHNVGAFRLLPNDNHLLTAAAI